MVEIEDSIASRIPFIFTKTLDPQIPPTSEGFASLFPANQRWRKWKQMWIQGSRTRRRKISTRIKPETNGVDQEIAKGRSKRHNLVRSQRASLDSPAQHDHCTGDDL